MTNSMDTILVKYSGGKKPISIQEFLSLPPEKLTSLEHKIQEATSLIYNLNGKKPPIYKNFHNQNPEKPLTINCVNPKFLMGIVAYYSDSDNEIGFVNGNENLVKSLAHELKHAEQHAQSEIQQIFDGKDNKAKQELLLLDEAESFFTGAMAFVETHQDPTQQDYFDEQYQKFSQECLEKAGHKDIQEIKQKMMENWIQQLNPETATICGLGYYLNQTEAAFLIHETDAGLNKIPAHFGLTSDFLKVLSRIPKNPKAAEQTKFLESVPNEVEKIKSSSKMWEKTLAEKISDWAVEKIDTPEKLQILFNAIKDENGNLPISREVFDIHDSTKNPNLNGTNSLLAAFHQAYENAVYLQLCAQQVGSYNQGVMNLLSHLIKKEYCVGALPVLMALKDKHGKPIITQKNIECFPEKSLLAPDIKSYFSKEKNKSTGLKNILAEKANQTTSLNPKAALFFNRKNIQQNGN